MIDDNEGKIEEIIDLKYLSNRVSLLGNPVYIEKVCLIYHLSVCRRRCPSCLPTFSKDESAHKCFVVRGR